MRNQSFNSAPCDTNDRKRVQNPQFWGADPPPPLTQCELGAVQLPCQLASWFIQLCSNCMINQPTTELHLQQYMHLDLHNQKAVYATFN